MKYKATQKDRYGNMKSLEITMDNQLEVPPMTSAVPMYDHPGEPKGTDTVPAWLTPGEFVVNKEATDMYGPLIKKMNDEGRKVQDMKEPMYATEGVEVPVNRPKYLMEDYVFDKLVKKYGYNPKVAAMVVGGLGGETNGLVASSHQMKGGPGRGIAQWEKGGRFDTDNTNLLAHAKNLGTDWDNLDTQIDFINKEKSKRKSINKQPTLHIKKWLGD